MACGPHGNLEILCGTHSPEDLELTPDGKYLIATQMVTKGHAGVSLFDLRGKRSRAWRRQSNRTRHGATRPGP